MGYFTIASFCAPLKESYTLHDDGRFVVETSINSSAESGAIPSDGTADKHIRWWRFRFHIGVSAVPASGLQRALRSPGSLPLGTPSPEA